MADSADSDARQSTTHRGLITCVIEHPSPRRQSLSCDLNGVLTLREFGRSANQKSTVEQPNDGHKV
jgi:hypothetical protein